LKSLQTFSSIFELIFTAGIEITSPSLDVSRYIKLEFAVKRNLAK